jgi:hypothetical protein
VTAPVHAVPLKRKAAGAAPDPDPLNPKVAVAPVATAPFQSALRTVTVAPAWETTPFQSWLTV